MNKWTKPVMGLAVAALSGCIFVIPESAVPGAQDQQMRQESVELDSEVATLALTLPAGDVDVEVGAVPGIEATLRWRGDDPPTLQIETVGDASTYDWSCAPARVSCSVNLTVTVPETLAELAVDINAGNVTTVGLSGMLMVDADAGNVDIVGHTGDIAVSLNAGDIDGTDLCADEVVADADAGNIQLDLCDRPSLVEAATNAGNIDIGVPAGSYAVQTGANLGNVTVDSSIVVDAGSDAAISADVDIGNIQIRGF